MLVYVTDIGASKIFTSFLFMYKPKTGSFLREQEKLASYGCLRVQDILPMLTEERCQLFLHRQEGQRRYCPNERASLRYRRNTESAEEMSALYVCKVTFLMELGMRVQCYSIKGGFSLV